MRPVGIFLAGMTAEKVSDAEDDIGGEAKPIFNRFLNGFTIVVTILLAALVGVVVWWFKKR